MFGDLRMDIRYLYRGTTEGWPGYPVRPGEEITCATTDPLVATLFAIECRNYGRAFILAARRDRLEHLVAPANIFDIIESAVNLRCSPLEFASRAEFVLGVDDSIAILRELGFVDVPVRLRAKSTLHQEIEDSHSLGLRLNREQAHLFNTHALEISHGRERA
jgi:hypothetical protein